MASLRDHADKLVRQKHFDAATIAAKLAEIQEKRAAVAELCTHKTNLLNLNYLYAKFMQVSYRTFKLNISLFCITISEWVLTIWLWASTYFTYPFCSYVYDGLLFNTAGM